MDDSLFKIHVWASHGNMKQFSSEVIAKLSKVGYEAELNSAGDTLTCYKIDKHGGFLGFGGNRNRKKVMTIIKRGSEVEIPKDEADPEFVELLAELLKQH